MKKVNVVPILTGAVGMGTVTNIFEKWIEKPELDLSMEKIQKRSEYCTKWWI